MRTLHALLLVVAPVSAQIEIQQLSSPVPRPSDLFGEAVAAGGGWLAVGSPGEGHGDVPMGRVLLYRENAGAFELHQVLTLRDQRRPCHARELTGPAYSCFGALFGRALALDGDRLLVGAPGYDRSGQAFVFRYDPIGATWEEEEDLTRLIPFPGPQLGDGFGFAVALDGDVAVVGAPNEDSFTGFAYVFERTSLGWGLSAVLSGQAPAANLYFGTSVDVDGDAIAVGEYRNAVSGFVVGAAYVFRRTLGGSWAREARILPEPQFVQNPSLTIYFGTAVSIRGGILAIGAMFFGSLGNTNIRDNPGAAYVYRLDLAGGSPAWVFQKELISSDWSPWDEFGNQIDVWGNRIVVTAHQKDVGPLEDAGSVYVFAWDGSDWIEEAILRPADLEDQQHFGTSVSCRGDQVVVGSGQDDQDGVYNSGSVSVFSLAK